GLGAHRMDRGHLVADREERVGERPFLGERVIVPRIVHAERGRVRHHPARVERGAQRPDLGTGHGPGDRAYLVALDHRACGKFMQSTKTPSKSGCAASETCSIRAATARTLSVSETRQSGAPSDAALPT